MFGPPLQVTIGKILDLSSSTLINATKVVGATISGGMSSLELEVNPTFPGGASDIDFGIEAQFSVGGTFKPVLSIRQGANVSQAVHTFAAATDGAGDTLVTTNLRNALAWRVFATSKGAVAATTAINAVAQGDAL